MSTIAVLGTGLLGAGFARSLLDKGHQVRVWNRTAAKAAPLADDGATVCDSPAAAVDGADRVHLVLSEDPAVDAVIDALRPALGSGVPIVDHSTNLPPKVAERAARLGQEGLRYLHAPVFMGPQNARDATGLMLISGPSAWIDELTPALSEMTGQVAPLGERPDQAAIVKLTGNGMLLVLTAGMGDLFRMLRAQGLSEQVAIELFEQFRPTPAGMGKRVLRAGEAPASFELTMGRKDCRLVIESAGGPDELIVMPAIAAAMDQAIEAGQGHEDFAIFARPR